MRGARVVLVGGVVAAVAAVLLAVSSSSPVGADYPTDCANPTATYPDASGMPTNLNLGPTDVVVFASGTFVGSVNSNLATVCVAAGAALNPASVNGATRLFVRGTALMPALAAGTGALLDNEGSVRFLPQPNTNGVATIINRGAPRSSWTHPASPSAPASRSLTTA